MTDERAEYCGKCTLYTRHQATTKAIDERRLQVTLTCLECGDRRTREELVPAPEENRNDQ